MNWTGGHRSRHSNTNARSIASIQKQHFAKARTKLQGRAHPVSPFAEFISGVEGCGLQKQVNERGFSQDQPGASDTRTWVRNVRSKASKVSGISAIDGVEAKGLGRDSLASRSRQIHPNRNDSGALWEQKRELLKQNDWVVTTVTRPLKIKYASAADGQKIGKRRSSTQHANRPVEFPRGEFVGASQGHRTYWIRRQPELTVQIEDRRAPSLKQESFTEDAEADMNEISSSKNSSEPMLFDHEGEGSPEVSRCSLRSRETSMSLSAYSREGVVTPSPRYPRNKQHESIRQSFDRIIAKQDVTASTGRIEDMELNLQRNARPEISSFHFLKEEKSLPEAWPISDPPGISERRPRMGDYDTTINPKAERRSRQSFNTRLNSIDTATVNMNTPASTCVNRTCVSTKNSSAGRANSRAHANLNYADVSTGSFYANEMNFRHLKCTDKTADIFTADKINPRVNPRSAPARRAGLNIGERKKFQKLSPDDQYWKAWLSTVAGSDQSGSEAEKPGIIYQEPVGSTEKALGSMLRKSGSPELPSTRPSKQHFETAPRRLRCTPKIIGFGVPVFEQENTNSSLDLMSDSYRQGGSDSVDHVWQRFVFGDGQDNECTDRSLEQASTWRSSPTDDQQSNSSITVHPDSLEAHDLSQSIRPQTPSSGLRVSSSPVATPTPLNFAQNDDFHSYRPNPQIWSTHTSESSKPGRSPDNKALQVVREGSQMPASFSDNPVDSASVHNSAAESWSSSLENHFAESRVDEAFPTETPATKAPLGVIRQPVRPGRDSSRRRTLTFRKPQRFEGSSVQQASDTKGDVGQRRPVRAGAKTHREDLTTKMISRSSPKRSCRKLSDLLFDDIEDD